MKNLDAMSIDELREFARAIDEGDDCRDDGQHLRWQYALTKADAMEHRASGDIVRAQHLERQCDTIYQKLPRHLAW